MTKNHPSGTLAQALDVQPGDTVAFVGAGGKTGLMFRLADGLSVAGSSVALTTTTKIGTGELPENYRLVIGSDIPDLISGANAAISSGFRPLLCSGIDTATGRLIGLTTNAADQVVKEAKEFDNLLIEADGAKHKPFKIPKSYEPVVPECVNKLCIVVGIDAFGQEITEENFYNVAGMLELGAVDKEPLTPRLMHDLLFHSTGFLRFKTPDRQVFLILNKCDDPDKIKDLQEITDELFHNDLTRILLTSTMSQPTVKYVPDNSNHKVSGMILAAGESTRFNGVKQLADIGGQTLIELVTKQVLASDLDEIVLVLGHEKDEVLTALKEHQYNKRLTIVENKDYRQGMSTSLKSGLKVLQTRADAIMFILGDQPRVTTELLNKLINAYKHSNAQLCVPVMLDMEPSSIQHYGNPVIIGRKLYNELLQITGDIGARDVMKKNISYAKLIELADDESQFQINTQEDLREYLIRYKLT